MSTAPSYRHNALAYSGEDDFVRFATTFLIMGLDDGEPGLLITSPRRIDNVRVALAELGRGDEAPGLRFLDTATEVRNPAVALSVLAEFAGEAGGRRVRSIGDLAGPGRTTAALAEAQLHEMLLNTPVCEDWNMWLTCPYDMSGLSLEDVETVALCHPKHRTDLSNLAAAKFGSELPPRPADAGTFPIDFRDLGSVRAIVRTAASMSGLDIERAEEFVYAVNEVISNSLRHGDGKAEIALWAEGESLVCEVHDGGRIVDPLTGRIPPSLSRTSGRGLWMVNHLCDLVQVRSPQSGTSVRMFIAPD